MLPFTHVISLGSDCRIAHHTRRFYGHGEGFPFDWWISPARSLVLYGETGFEPDALFDPGDLEEVRSSSGKIASIRNRRLGMRLHHEFARDKESADYDVLPAWRDEISERKRRHTHLLVKVRGLNDPSKSILFVRGSSWGDTTDDLTGLAEAMTLLVPLARRQFLFVNYEVALPPGSLSMTVDDTAAKDWKGDQGKWDAALAAADLKVETFGLKPYRGLSPEGERVIQ